MSDTESENGPMDFDRVQETSGGDVEFERELFDVFIQDCADRIARLSAALEKGDIEAVHLEAHTLKGAGSNVGTAKLHLLAAQLEKTGPGDLAGPGAALLAAMEAEFGRVKNAMRAYLEAR